MLKVIALIRRRADLSRAEFRRHYEEIHAPLALRHLDQLSGYVRNHVTAELDGGPAGFDCLTEFWYADRAALQSVLAYMGSPAAEPIRRDELTFMAREENVILSVEERLVLGARSNVARSGPDTARAAAAAPSAGSAKTVILAACPRGEPRETFLRRQDAALRAWLEAGSHAPTGAELATQRDWAARLLRCTHDAVLPAGGAPSPWDSITVLWHAAWPASDRRPGEVGPADCEVGTPRASDLEPGSEGPSGPWREPPLPSAERRLCLRVMECVSPLGRP